MNADQPAQGSTADYCSAHPGDRHNLYIHVRANALVSVRRCRACGWIDFDDLREQALALIEDGRREATGGMRREWQVEMPGADWVNIDDEQVPHLGDWPKRSRLVGPWEPDAQAPPTTHARGCVCGWNDAGQRFDDPICRRR